MKNSFKKRIIDFLLFVITTIISFVICYNFLDDIFLPAYVGDYGHLFFRLLISFLLFITLKWVFNKEINLYTQKALFFLYFVFLISLSLSRPMFSSTVKNLNFKIGYIHDSSIKILLANIFMYLPVGYFVRKYFKLNKLILISLFFVYILIIEILQYTFRVGFFDINDILLNLFGYIAGITIYYLKIELNLRSLNKAKIKS